MHRISDNGTENPLHVIASTLKEILQRLDKIERKTNVIGEDVAIVDRTLRPYGDGTRIRERRRWN